MGGKALSPGKNSLLEAGARVPLPFCEGDSLETGRKGFLASSCGSRGGDWRPYSIVCDATGGAILRLVSPPSGAKKDLEDMVDRIKRSLLTPEGLEDC